MRSGRPSYHIKAKWVTCFNPDSNIYDVYELDAKGNLVKSNGDIVPHHVVQIHQEINLEPPDVNHDRINEIVPAPEVVINETEGATMPVMEIQTYGDALDDGVVNFDDIGSIFPDSYDLIF